MIVTASIAFGLLTWLTTPAVADTQNNNNIVKDGKHITLRGVDNISDLAQQVLWERTSGCHGDIGTYYTATLNDDVKAEIIHIQCTAWCGSGGCHSYIIVREHIYKIFGSKPIILKGVLKDFLKELIGDEIIVIGWFGYAGPDYCSDRNFICLLTLYYDTNQKLIRHMGEEITDDYR